MGVERAPQAFIPLRSALLVPGEFKIIIDLSPSNCFTGVSCTPLFLAFDLADVLAETCLGFRSEVPLAAAPFLPDIGPGPSEFS